MSGSALKAQLKSTGKQALQDYLDKVVKDREVPAVSLGVTNKDGELWFGCGGERVFGQPEEGQIGPDTILQLFSMTKFITSVACWQLVDRGLISMDDPDVVEKYCPELGKLQILEGYTDVGKEIMTKPKTRITLKMLLTHTSGLAYAFNNEHLLRWMTEHKVPSMLGANAPLESYLLPLVFEPGTRFNYSIGIDFAGFIVAAASGMSLEDYFQKNIFEPCGVTSISFHPPADYEAKKQAMCERVPVHTGKVKLMDGPAMGRTLDPKAIGPYYSGGGGLFGTARDYLKVLTKVLASAESESLISPKSFKALFVDGTPDSAVVKADLARMATGQCIHDPAILTEGTGQHVGYSPGLFLNFIDSKWGRLAMSGFWDGAAKTMFWIDPSTGIAAVCCTNLLSHNPDPWNQVYNGFERTLYDHLDSA